MNSTNKGAVALGFLAGLGVAVACGARSMSSAVDAGPVDTKPIDTGLADGSTPQSLDRLRVRTADTDIEQQVEDTVHIADSGAFIAVAAGPVVITDSWTSDPKLSGHEMVVAGDLTCGTSATRPKVARRELTGPLHGLRIIARAGEYLCVGAGVGGIGVDLAWSGYKPYSEH